MRHRARQTKERVAKILAEYLDSRDAAEASRCLRQVRWKAARMMGGPAAGTAREAAAARAAGGGRESAVRCF